MRILLPISLDRWKNPICALLRAVVEFNPQHEFHAFSSPLCDEDSQMGEVFWKRANLQQCHPSSIMLRQFDVVHTASYSNGNFVASCLSKLRGLGHTRFLNTMNLEPDPQDPVAWSRYEKLLRAADAFVAVSEAVAADFRKRCPSRFLGVIPNGFDPSFYDPLLDMEGDLPEEVRHLGEGYPLWVAALEQRKHPEVLVYLAELNPGITFVALGGVVPGGEHFAKAFEQTPNICWLGPISRRQARAVLSKAGVMLFPSEREGLSLAMIEALAMGIPIIAQPKSSMPELVQPGVNGELIDIADLSSWQQALLRLVGMSQQQRRHILSTVRNHAVQQYSWEVVGSAYATIYEKLTQLPRKLIHPLSDAPPAPASLHS